jgi:hypothetical protein
VNQEIGSDKTGSARNQDALRTMKDGAIG